MALLVVATLSLVACSPDSDDRVVPTRSAETDAGRTVRVPPLVDLPVVLAQEELRRLGLEFEVTRAKEVNECPIEGRCVSGATVVVSAQYPYAGTRVSENSTVVLDVSKFVEDQG